jgi:hypothetical protein
MRASARAEPRRKPWRRIAMQAYSEQVGRKMQRETPAACSSGEKTRL